MKNSDKQNARIELDTVLQRVMIEFITDHTQLYRLFSEDQVFKKWVSDAVFNLTYKEGGAEAR